MERVYLTKYPVKAVRQLLNNNNNIRKILPVKTNEEIAKHISDRYILTEKQLEYFLNKI